MSLPKSKRKIIFALLIIFSNFWIYRIFNENLIIALVLIFSSLLIIIKPKNIPLVVLSLIVVIFFQIQTTDIKSLTNLDNDQQRVQAERIRSYPLTYIPVFSKAIWFKPQIWIEQNKFVTALSKIEENFFDVLDINKYFFSGSPRNNNSDFPKFIFILLPIFVYGLIKAISQKLSLTIGLLSILPLLILSFTSNENKFGPFSLFPFFVFTMTFGIMEIFENLNKKYENKK